LNVRISQRVQVTLATVPCCTKSYDHLTGVQICVEQRVMPPLFRYADPGVRVGVALWPDQLVFGDVLVRNAAAGQLWN
jgi:hypothetical protein